MAYFTEKETEAQRPCDLCNSVQQGGGTTGLELRFLGPDVATPSEPTQPNALPAETQGPVLLTL